MLQAAADTVVEVLAYGGGGVLIRGETHRVLRWGKGVMWWYSDVGARTAVWADVVGEIEIYGSMEQIEGGKE